MKKTQSTNNIVVNTRQIDYDHFNALTQTVFEFDFSLWRDLGFWSEKYIPHTIIEDGQVLANVSANLIEVAVLEKKYQCVQIGTVMTHPQHRNKGFIRYLMNTVLDKYKDADLIYLYTDHADFYQQFDFKEMANYHYELTIKNVGLSEPYEKLDPFNPNHQKIIARYYEIGNPYSQCNVVNNYNLLMFHLISQEHIEICHLPHKETLILYDRDRGILYDVFAVKATIPLEILADWIGVEPKILLGFTPIDKSDVIQTLNTSNRIFVIGDCEDLIPLFPLLSIA